MRRSTGGDVFASNSRPARSAASRNGISYRWVASHGRQCRKYGGSISSVSRAETSPLAIGSTTTERIVAAIASSASMLVMPAAFNGLAAS
ncbi:hypothetical protein BH20ACT6_BH20ACT6_20530 [soil metagenome]